MATYRNTPQFPTGSPRTTILIGFWVVIILLLLWTSVYTVPADSVAVVQRFGAYLKTVEPGLQFKIPYGVDTMTIVPVRRQLKMEFGFSATTGSNPYQESKEADLEKAMVTGDLNAALVEWVVQYRISNPRDYRFAVRDPEETMRAAAEAVMREIIGDRTVDEVITIGRQDIESNVQASLQKVVTSYSLGLAVDTVQLKNVNPPREVQGSFDEVNQAQQEKQRAINIADGDYNKAVPRASGESSQVISQARGYALQRVNEAEGDAQRFTALLAEYQRAPEIMRQRLYLETMIQVMPTLERRIIVDDKGQQILPFLQLGNEKK
jgi:modulator of FtsH protease HflK